MMAQRSPLDALLRVRAVVEDQQELRMQRANALLNEAKAELLRLREDRLDAMGKYAAALRRGAVNAELQVISADAVDQAIEKQRLRIAALEADASKALSEYLRRRRERETVESAIERKHAEQVREMERKSQSRMDEAALQRLFRSGRNSRP